MIIDSEKIIDLSAFKICESLTIQEYDIGVTRVFTLENFYEDFEKAHREMKKLPLCPILNSNNIDHFDGRACYSQNMLKTECPFVTDYRNLVSQLANVPVGRVDVDDKILFNALQFTTDWLDYKNNWYNIHRDIHKDIINERGVVTEKSVKGYTTLILFMNKHYEEGEGFNIYNFSNEKITETISSKDEWKPIFSLQGKPNSGIIFNGEMPHGACISTDQFTKELRYTQVHFALIDP